MARSDSPARGETITSVLETGIALLHAGDRIVAAPGSEAELSPVAMRDDDGTVHYHFPVEIEVVGAGDEPDLHALADHVLQRLADGIAGTGLTA